MGEWDAADDKLKEACGICGGVSRELPVAYLTCFALYALQHRGQQSAGMAVGKCKSRIWSKRGPGLVSEVFPDTTFLKEMKGRLAIGHVRYSTRKDSSNKDSAQPLVLNYRHGEIAIAHNGRLTNAAKLREGLEVDGAIFQTNADSELLAHLIARQGGADLEESLAHVAPRLKGAFSFVITDGEKVIGLRDSHGFRPLSLASLGKSGYYLASETCAFDTMGAAFMRDVEPGEMVTLEDGALRSRRILESRGDYLCIFEYIYFARPDSNLQGINVHLARRKLGRKLAREQPAAADIVTGVPDSSIAAASGYAEEASLPYEMALVKNRYIGRTFIQPTQCMREEGVDLKLNAVSKIVEGKRVVIVDDSIVRGTTSLKLVRLMRRAGAREVHFRVSSPPVISPCYYGIDTPDASELIAYGRSTGEIARLIGADSVGFLSHEGMVEAVGLKEETLCRACFDRCYLNEEQD